MHFCARIADPVGKFFRGVFRVRKPKIPPKTGGKTQEQGKQAASNGVQNACGIYDKRVNIQKWNKTGIYGIITICILSLYMYRYIELEKPLFFFFPRRPRRYFFAIHRDISEIRTTHTLVKAKKEFMNKCHFIIKHSIFYVSFFRF